MRNVDCPSSFPQLRKANQGFNPITSLSPIFVEAVLDEYVELVSEALLEKVAEAICEKLKRQLVQEKYKFFCTKFRKFCASLFWDLYPLCTVRCTVQVRAHLGLTEALARGFFLICRL